MAATGTATLDFGAFPGAAEASVDVTGQGGIVAGSLIEAWRMPTVDTADKTADEQRIENFRVIACEITAGIGFKIRGTVEPFVQTRPTWQEKSGGFPTPSRAPAPSMNERQRLHGKYHIGWAWN